VIRLGTRGSALALAQARLVADVLSGEVELVPIRTSGDEGRRGAQPPPAQGGDKARFVKEIEEALLAGEIDLAVHSAKDVPSDLPPDLAIVGVPERADSRDALCGARTLAELDEGAAVGTSSLRRRAQLLALRPDLDLRELRGNVDTRLRRLAEGRFDALVLARAGLERLGRGTEGTALAELVPAPGQGCLALEARAEDGRAGAAAGEVTDRSALVCLTAERALVAGLDATCRTPVGAHAELVDGALRLTAFAGLADGSHWIRDELDGDSAEPTAVGEQVAERMLAAGARELLDAADAPAPGG
jgi:hydroxymethylbilane synthase